MTVASIFRPRGVRKGTGSALTQLTRGRLLWAIWLGLLAGGIALAVWASIDDHFPADIAVGRWMQDNDVAGQEVLDFVRDVGSGLASTATVLVMVALLAVLRRPRISAASATLLLGLVLIALLKEGVDRPRTSILFLQQQASFDSASFPSGHVTGSLIAAALVLFVALRVLRPWWFRAPLAIWAVGVGALGPWVSVTGGVHWPSDALGGIVWAAVVVVPGWALLERARRAEGGSSQSGGRLPDG